jgi:hypothetical protein
VGHAGDGEHRRHDPDEDRPASAGARAPTSVRAVLAVVVAFFALILLALVTGGLPEERRVRTSPSPSEDRTKGILVYAVPDGSGAARLWLWRLFEGDVEQGPLIREPLEMVNVRSPGYGWIGFTSDLGNGVLEAAVLDSLEPAAEAEPVGSGDLVTWTREGGTVILVDRGPVRGDCRRRVVIDAEHLDVEGGQSVLDDTICGDVLTVGRTSLGYFMTRQRPGGADIVGAGYEDAGVLLADHGLIAISPGGEMLVTPSSRFLPASPSPDGSPAVAGEVSSFTQFGGRPVPYLVRGAPLRVEEVLAYAPGSTRALVVGRLPGEDPGLWELPLGVAGAESRVPRFVGVTRGFTAAAYGGDGTAFVVTGGGLWELRDQRLRPLEVPDGAPAPSGPLVWVLREPLTEL